MRRTIGVLTAVIALLAMPAAALAGLSKPQRALRRSLSRALKSAGRADGGEVLDLTTGKTLFAAAPRVGRIPASVEKIYTTSAALARLGANGSLVTQILGSGSLDATGGWHGTLYLKGGGDPTFGSASFDSYAYGTGATMERLVANLIRSSGITSVSGAIVGDESLFDSLRGTVATAYRVSTDLEGVLSAVVFDRGLADPQGAAFQTRPALFSAQQLAAALRAANVPVAPGTRVYTGPAPAGAQVLASVHSPRISTLLKLTNTPSDNFFAEMLLKDIGALFGGAGTTAAGAAVVRSQVAHSFGIHPRLDDGSGLSRDDRTSPRDVVTALTKLSANQAFVNSLSVAGVSGTMQSGLRRTAAQGRCRGKTGTLHDVANLVGYCTGRDRHKLVFAFLMNSLGDPAAGHAIEDRMAVSLAKYNG